MYQPINELNRTIDIFNDNNASLGLKAMWTLDDIEIDAGYFWYIEEDNKKLMSKITWNHFKLDDITEEENISKNILKILYTMDELQDDGFDLAILKILELKHMKKIS